MRHLIRLIAVRHLVRAPLRSLLTVFGTAIAVAGMVSISSASHAVLASYEQSMQQLSGKVELEVGSGDAPVQEALLEPLTRLHGVAHISPVLEAKAHHVDSGEGLLMMGLDFTGDDYFRDLHGAASDIDPLEFLNCRNCLLLAGSFARRHGIHSGDSIKLATPSGVVDFRVKDLLSDDGPAQAYGGNVAIMYLDAAQLLFERQGRYDRIDLAMAPGVTYESLEQEVRHVVGAGVAVERPARRGERTGSMMTRFRTGMQVISLLALLVSMFMIYNTISIAVAQRRREIGVLRALGVTRAEVRRLFVGEALTLATLGSALGVILGRQLAFTVLQHIHGTITNLYVDVNPQQAEITPSIVLVSVGICLLTTAVSALLPAATAAQTAPALSMQRGGLTAALPRLPWAGGLLCTVGIALLATAVALIPRAWVPAYTGEVSMVLSVLATVCLTPALIEVASRVLRLPLRRLLGVPGQLAVDSLRRDGPRAVITVAALTVGLGLAMGASTFVSGFQTSVGLWLEQSVPADLFATGSAPLGSGNVRLPASLYDPLRHLPHVNALERATQRKLNLGDIRVSITATDTILRLSHGALEVLEGDLGDLQDYARERRILVSDNLAWRQGIHAGQQLTLQTPSGSRTFKVQAIYVDYTSDFGALLLDRRWYVQDFQDDTVDAYAFYVDAPQNVAALRQSIVEKLGRQHDLYVITNKELRAQAEDIVQGTFTITSAMSSLAVVVALLGVMNTLIGAVVDRTRELGVLRAIGTSSLQVVQVFVYEALLLALCGGILGALTGHILGLLFVKVVNVQDTGWHIGFYPDWPFQGLVLLLAVLAAAIAAIGPAWRGSRQPITEALLYE